MIIRHRLTCDELAAIAARSNEATPGPWRWDTEGDADSSARVVATSIVAWLVGSKDQAAADARFIAHARTDVPLLLTYIRTLEAEIRLLEQRLTESREAAERERELHRVLVAELQHRARARLRWRTWVAIWMAAALIGMLSRLAAQMLGW